MMATASFAFNPHRLDMSSTWPPLQLDILEEINDEFGTDYDLLTSWEAVLSKDVDATPEANGETSIDRNVETLGGILGGEDLPSEDEDDADYRYDELYHLC